VLALLLVLAFPALAAPVRVASIGHLCTDELVLLLARPGQVVSVTSFGHDADETPLAGKAKGLHRNNGTLTSVVALDPDLVITAGLGGQTATSLAARLGIAVLDVPPPRSIADMRANIRRVAAALGTPARGEAIVGWMDARLGAPPPTRRPALMVTAGGLTPAADSVSAELLAHAGIAHQTQPAQRVSREWLRRHAGLPLVLSRYRAGQFSMAQQWQDDAAGAARRVHRIDGRAWTCPGPLAAADVARLRQDFTR
jgi:iron complex transport system substrate-binding protein